MGICVSRPLISETQDLDVVAQKDVLGNKSPAALNSNGDQGDEFAVKKSPLPFFYSPSPARRLPLRQEDSEPERELHIFKHNFAPLARKAYKSGVGKEGEEEE